jgi:hypothetical protein
VSVREARPGTVLQHSEWVIGRIRRISWLDSRVPKKSFVKVGVSQIDFVCDMSRRATENGYLA